jgi:signal transduction histidine kinase
MSPCDPLIMALVMKERLSQVERSQLAFATAASHELRTPLHQINAAATLLRAALSSSLNSPMVQPASILPVPRTKSPDTDPNPNTLAPDNNARRASMNSEDRSDALSQLEIIEANGLALGNILENIIDTLDIGRMSTRAEEKMNRETDIRMMATSAAVPDISHVPVDNEKMSPAPAPTDMTREMERSRSTTTNATDLGDVLEKVVEDCLDLENKARRVAGRASLDEVEIILEVLPRNRGGWLMEDDPGPLSRSVVEKRV